ncbi:DUF421 domain-containing protein [Mesobacillus maritimus]|uniref:DUF421 domain-containing protein n=1 Tax=Mesobacillus maritimus TaxID=1643336 RepID=UPI00203B224E|nr:DUF421 domain-containing protein [Mesobacillus maritimus]MCM3585259.1 DUF421 domain-containing protein [Mesobacillus maritimus]
MDILIDSIKVIGRIVTVLPLMLMIGLFMGRRSIGELPVFDILVILVFGTVLGADIADLRIDHIHTFVAVISIGLLHRFIIYIKLNNHNLRRIMTFEPTVIVYKGEFLPRNMKKINYSMDNILQMLREKDIFQINDVEMAIVEASGRLSVTLKMNKRPVTGGDLNLSSQEAEGSIPLILDGKIDRKVLKGLNKDKEWLLHELNEKHNIDQVAEVFYAELNKKGEWSITLKNHSSAQQQPPPIFH